MAAVPNNDVVEEVDGSLQALSARSLEYTDYLDMPVFNQATVITAQPETETRGARRPIPISTQDWQSTSLNHMVPPSGLDFLRGVDELLIQQTVELVDILAYVESENRFQVKVPGGETLYVAAESSSKTQRMCCASNRSFEMRMFDHSHQEAIRLNRKLACSNFLFGCCLQELQVFSDVDLYAGCVIQEWTVGAPSFQLINSSGQIMYRLVGPMSATTCCGSNYQAKFDVLNPDCTNALGNIVHSWDNISSDYVLTVSFPSAEITTEMKAVILGAAFLLEYMYFETSKRRGVLAALTCGCC